MTMFEGHQHVELDLLSEESIKEAVESVMATCGQIDILINNAGMPCTASLAEVPIAMDKVFRTNYLGKGKIVNVGSITSFAAGPFAGAYSASKAALQWSTDALRLELKPFNIDVMHLVPGAVVTDIAPKGTEIVKSYLNSLQIFQPCKEYLLKRTMLAHDPKSTPAPAFAKNSIVARSTPACFVYGFMSRVYRILDYCPYWIRDWWFSSKMPKWMTMKKVA